MLEDDWLRTVIIETRTLQVQAKRNNSSRNGHVFTASHREEKPCDNIWILDSGASCHMAKEPVWFKNISPEVMDIYLADKNSKMMSQGTGNVSAKTVSTKHCNSINLTITDVSYVPQLRSNRTRPDISFVISYLSQFNHNPEKRHYNLAKRVLRYLMGSKDKKLFYENVFGILNASSDASCEMQKMENHFLEV
ncbi:retrovirus-related Pol polyprotein from transposon TNT 1-94 [Trichonephila clavipes]|nr:retrovirus-related Pol polyprotein from transposon TNT 1-94 [Trichonephila clavipes]